MKTSWFYDIECYPNYFSVTAIEHSERNKDPIDHYIEADKKQDDISKAEILKWIDYKFFEISSSTSILDCYSTIVNIIDFLNMDIILIGYNNHKYDDILMKWFIREYSTILGTPAFNINQLIYAMSDNVINNMETFYMDDELKALKYMRVPFVSIDLMHLHHLNVPPRISLKSIAVILKWHRIEDLPIKVGTIITKEQIPIIRDYNFNDVLITRLLYLEKYNEIKLRLAVNKGFGINVLSEPRPKVGEIIITNLIRKQLPKNVTIRDIKDKAPNRRFVKLGELVDPNIKFTHPNLIKFLEEIKNTNIQIGVDKFNPAVIVEGTKYQFGVGGIHSVDRPKLIKANEKFIYRDADVTSFYPNIILNLEITPGHLAGNIFLKPLRSITNNRVKFKTLISTGDPEKKELYEAYADILKIVINSIFGKMGDEFSILKDHRAMYATTVNGQLYILTLVDMLVNKGFFIVSANTDGIVTKIPVINELDYIAICEEWEKTYNFNLEYTDYDLYVRSSVNDYIARSTKGKIKLKGCFDYHYEHSYNHLRRTWDKPVVAKSVIDYFLNDTPIDIGIRESTDILDYCMAVKVGHGFVPTLNYIESGDLIQDKLQKSIRYFASNSGGSLVKIGSNKINMLKGYKVEVVNNLHTNDAKAYDINYSFYKKECFKLIDDILGRSVKSQKNTSGTLFDDL